MSGLKQNWRIDVHHHVVPPRYADDSMPIKLPETAMQLQSMDSWHIQTAITSLTPRVVLKHLDRLRIVARECNEFQAEKVGNHPARFGAFVVAKSNAGLDGSFYHTPDSTLSLQTYRDSPLGVVANDNDRGGASPAARDIAPGERWAFVEHRTMAEVFAAERLP